MSTIERISVELTPEMAAFVREAVRRGEYGSSHEVVEEALQRLREQSDSIGYSVEELRRLVQEGIDSGPGLDADVVFARLRAKYAGMTGPE